MDLFGGGDFPSYDDGFDPFEEYGPAFNHGPGIMGPPPRPGTFDYDMARSLTPPGRRTPRELEEGYDEFGLDTFGRGLYFDGREEDFLGGRRRGMVSDNLLSELARERDIDLLPPDLEPEWDPLTGRREIGEDFELGQRPAFDDGRLHGMLTDGYIERPSILDVGFPGGMRPTPKDRLPEMAPNRLRSQHAWRETWPGWNDSMPEGAIGYVSRDEVYGWGRDGGPEMFPAEWVDDEFIREREQNPYENPFFLNEEDDAEMLARLRDARFAGERPYP